MFLNNYLVIRGKYLPGASDVSEMDVVASLKVLPLLLRKAVLLYLYERQAVFRTSDCEREELLPVSVFLCKGRHSFAIFSFVLSIKTKNG